MKRLRTGGAIAFVLVAVAIFAFAVGRPIQVLPRVAAAPFGRKRTVDVNWGAECPGSPLCGARETACYKTRMSSEQDYRPGLSAKELVSTLRTYYQKLHQGSEP